MWARTLARSCLDGGRMRLTNWFWVPALFGWPCIHAQSPAQPVAQPAKRIAVIAGNGPLERAAPIWAIGENRLTVSLTGKLAGKPGITLIAQSDIDMLLKAQNFENSDRSSTETAA